MCIRDRSSCRPTCSSSSSTNRSSYNSRSSGNHSECFSSYPKCFIIAIFRGTTIALQHCVFLYVQVSEKRTDSPLSASSLGLKHKPKTSFGALWAWQTYMTRSKLAPFWHLNLINGQHIPPLWQQLLRNVGRRRTAFITLRLDWYNCRCWFLPERSDGRYDNDWSAALCADNVHLLVTIITHPASLCRSCLGLLQQ